MQIRGLLLAILIVSASALGLAQSTAPRYETPPKAIVDIMDAAPLPGVAVSPLRDIIALVPRRSRSQANATPRNAPRITPAASARPTRGRAGSEGAVASETSVTP